MTARAIRGNKVFGYQLAVYTDKPTARIQIVLAGLAPKHNWVAYADGMVLSVHKVKVRSRRTSSYCTMLGGKFLKNDVAHFSTG